MSMSQRIVALVPGEYYHTYNRGADKRIIFLDDADRRRFVELLYLANTTSPINVRDVRRRELSVFDFDRKMQRVHIGAYCLMPNHFHILLTAAQENGVQDYMQKLLTAYSMYFNKRYARTGTLFEGRFKSEHVDSDEYLKYLFSYIHLNPVKLIQSDWKEVGIRDLKKVRAYLDAYAYSSLHDYFVIREESKILDQDKFPGFFSTKKEIDDELIGWLRYREDLQLN